MEQDKPHSVKAIHENIPKLLCSHHKSQIIKVCIKPNCRYQRYYCSFCFTSSNQKKHLSEHMSLSQMEELFSIQTSPKIYKSIPKFQKQIIDYFQVGQKQFKKYTKILWNKMFSFLTKTEGQISQQGYSNSNLLKQILNFKPDKQQTHILMNFVDFNLFRSQISNSFDRVPQFPEEHFLIAEVKAKIQQVMVSILAYFKKIFQKIILDIRYKDEMFQNIKSPDKSEKIDISSEQDFKKIKIIDQSKTLSINLQSIRDQPLDKFLKKIQPLTIDNVSFSFFNYPNYHIPKLILPSNVNEFIFNISNREVTSTLINNLSIITKKYLNEKVPNLKQRLLQKLSVISHKSKLNNLTLQSYGAWISMFSSITHLTLDLKFNSISGTGVYYLMNEINKLRNLTHLSLDFGGFKEQQNNMYGTIGFLSVILRNLDKLKSLELGLSNTNLCNNDILALANSLIELSSLHKLSLSLQKNQNLTCITAFAHKISFTKITTLFLCLDGIDVRMDKLTKIIQSLNYSKFLNEASITAKNCNLFEDKISNKKKHNIKSRKVKINLSY